VKGKTQKKPENRMKILLLGFGVLIAVVLTLVFYMLGAGSLELPETLLFPIVIIIVLLATFVLIKRAKAYKAGLPFEDELAKKVQWKAGYYTFLVTIYVALGTAWYADYMEEAGTPLPARYVAYIIILASAILFFAFYFYFNRKGDV